MAYTPKNNPTVGYSLPGDKTVYRLNYNAVNNIILFKGTNTAESNACLNFKGALSDMNPGIARDIRELLWQDLNKKTVAELEKLRPEKPKPSHGEIFGKGR